ncbi:hydroxypyruvate isomerase [Arthrobacter sp. PGP41]|uniref:hydroxypyruvate isomerase family protein n=1 Tax=unclassified Arthrobacter TaxID=235627 RepID=UPI000CDCBF7A|nr:MULTISPECIES: TIM barrel protein [unclassified Arthrobacter]AUZ36109.1 hydroxypyruvate isomerase [Arthrobacter sp. PGP41]MDT0194422.1 TIM barrel protein [Arthrobacter sp. AB6]
MTYTVNCSILLTELPLLERPAAAKAAGFDAVEFWWPFESSVPSDAQVTEFENAIKDAGVQLTGLNFNAGNMPGGDRGLVSWTGRESEFKDNIEVVAGIGARLGCKAFNALYGNRQDGSTPEEQDELAVRNLAAAAEGVARIGGTVLLEPVSGAPKYPLLTADDALKVIARVKAEAGVENIKLLADFYHLSVNGDDVESVIENHAKDFGHIQIADNPGRGAPGTGTLPLGQWIARSRELGYNGYIGLEYKEPQETAFSWAIREHASR